MKCEECGEVVRDDRFACGMCGTRYCEKCAKEIRACILFDADEEAEPFVDQGAGI